MKNSVAVSVIIPCLNCETTIRRAVESVFMSNHLDSEVIAVDDGSTDGTLKVLAELSSKWPSLSVIHQKKSGANPARNKGLESAVGTYIQFLDADDYLLGDKLIVSVNLMDGNSQLMCVYTDGQKSGVEGGKIEAHHENIKAIVNHHYNEFTFGMNTNMPLWRSQYIVESGEFWDNELVCWQESEYYFRLLLNLNGEKQVKHVPQMGFVRSSNVIGISSHSRTSRYLKGKIVAVNKILSYSEERYGMLSALSLQRDDFMWQIYRTAVLAGSDDVIPVLKSEFSNKRIMVQIVLSIPAYVVRGIHKALLLTSLKKQR